MDILDKIRQDYGQWWDEQWQIHYGPPPPNPDVRMAYKLLNQPTCGWDVEKPKPL